MKERPILFSAPMVRAILAGTKTQTRRVVRPQPDQSHSGNPYWHIGGYRASESAANPLPCPYGVPGDRLWVRETFMVEPHPADIGITREMIPRTWDSAVAAAGTVHFAADPRAEILADGRRWKPSIHMPRALSRIDLEVTGVRVERLQDISEADAMAEGIIEYDMGDHGPLFGTGYPDTDLHAGRTSVEAFQNLWNSINGKPHIERREDGSEIKSYPNGWDANPWIWVVEFQRLQRSNV